MKNSMIKRFFATILTVLTLFSCFGVNTFAANTSWKPILNTSDISNPQPNKETYKIKVGYFTTSKKVTLGTAIYNNVRGTDRKLAASLARFDVTVQYNGKNACYIRNYYGLKTGDSFYLTGKKWNETKTYTITVRSYFSKSAHSNFDAVKGNYRMKY